MRDPIAPGEPGCGERDFPPEFGAVGLPDRNPSFHSERLDSVQIQPAGGCSTGQMVLKRPCCKWRELSCDPLMLLRPSQALKKGKPVRKAGTQSYRSKGVKPKTAGLPLHSQV